MYEFPGLPLCRNSVSQLLWGRNGLFYHDKQIDWYNSGSPLIRCLIRNQFSAQTMHISHAALLRQ